MTSFNELFFTECIYYPSHLCHPLQRWKQRLTRQHTSSDWRAGWLPWSLPNVAKETLSKHSFVDYTKFRKEFYLPMSRFNFAYFLGLAHLPVCIYDAVWLSRLGKSWPNEGGKALLLVWKQRSVPACVLSQRYLPASPLSVVFILICF